MSLIKIRRIATLNSEDKRDGKDSIADKEREYTQLYELAQKNITFYAAKGDSAKVVEWKRKADEYKRLAQEAENAAKATDAKDSIAADAKFKVGQIVHDKNDSSYKYKILIDHGLQRDSTGTHQTYLVRDLQSNNNIMMPENALAADSHAADVCDAAAKDKTPDGWWEGKTIFAAFGWGKSVKGKVVSHKGGVIKLEDGTKFKESDAYDLYAIDSSASDAAELRVVHAKGIGKWWVEPNLSRFNDADREQTHKGRKEFPDREAAMKYARGTGKTFIVNDACGKGEDAEKFRVGQKVKHTRFGTIGKVFEIAPDGGIGVQWSNGQAYYGEFHRPLSEIVAVDK